MGYGSIVYLSAITTIDSQFYEAARIDGATKWQQIRYVTLPILKPTIALLLMFSLGGILKGQFELFYQLVGTNGLLYSTTDIIDTYVYRIGIKQTNYSFSTAAGMFKSVIALILIVSVNFAAKKSGNEGIW